MTEPKIIPLEPASNSKTNTQGNEPDSEIIITDPDSPVNLDESIMPPPKTVHVYPPQPEGDDK